MRTPEPSKDRFVYLSICRGILAFCLLLIPSPARAAGATGPEGVTCARCIVVSEDGTVLWSRNARDRYPNASTTKMVTALLVARATEPGDLVTVSPAAGAVGGGGLDLGAAETYTVDALLHALLLDSSNEAAQALAEHVAGSADRFVERMNAYVERLGARRTQFANPHGLDAEGHYSSAADLASIGAELLADPYLAKIVGRASVTIPTPDGPETIENRNLLLESYKGAVGIKTGRTLGSGNVLVAAAERGRHRLIAVAMYSYDSFADSAALLDYGFAELRRRDRRGTLVEKGEIVGELVFDSGSIPVAAGESLEARLPSEPGNLEVSVAASDAGLPIEAADVVGVVTVSTERGIVGTVPAVATTSVGEVAEAPWWTGALRGLVSLVGGVFG